MTTQELLIAQSEEELETEMASGLHAVLGGIVHGFLFSYVYPKRLGWVLNSSATFNFKDGLSRREPDVSFVSLEKMPVPLDDELPFPPDLAVEVVSKNDKDYEIEAKVKQYQEAGVKLIWIIHPFSQTIEVYQLSTRLKSQRLVGDEELNGLEVLPGFSLKVSAIFA